MSLQWKPEFSVNVKIIDDQHKELLQALGELQDAKRAGNGPDVLEIAFAKLFSYAQYHFATEERYLALFSCADAEEHIAAHRRLLDELSRSRRRFYEEGAGMIDGLIEFVERWFVGHDVALDKKFTKCFNEHGLS